MGIIGFPNAGKSTLISVLSSARPKIGDYPFTTLTPNLGVVQAGSAEPFTMADIPGLIQGAHSGTGLGIKFLRHIERTRLLVHLIDASVIDPEDPLKAYLVINQELNLFSEKLAEKPQLIVLNKLDMPEADAGARAFQSALPGNRVMQISAITHKNTDALILHLAQRLDDLEGIQWACLGILRHEWPNQTYATTDRDREAPTGIPSEPRKVGPSNSQAATSTSG